MRKTVTALLTASLVLGAFAGPMSADAKKKKKKKKVTREASADYTLPGTIGYATISGTNVGGVAIPTGGTEKFVMAEVVDASGQAVPASLQQDLNGNNSSGEAGEPAYDFCGKTDKPLAITPGSDVIVYVGAGPCGGGAAAGTQGTVKLVLSNRP